MTRIRKRVLRSPTIILIGVITGVIGLGILFFMMQLIDQTSNSNNNGWGEMSCVKLIFFEYKPEHNALSETEHTEYHKALEPCLEI